MGLLDRSGGLLRVLLRSILGGGLSSFAHLYSGVHSWLQHCCRFVLLLTPWCCSSLHRLVLSAHSWYCCFHSWVHDQTHQLLWSRTALPQCLAAMTKQPYQIDSPLVPECHEAYKELKYRQMTCYIKNTKGTSRVQINFLKISLSMAHSMPHCILHRSCKKKEKKKDTFNTFNGSFSKNVNVVIRTVLKRVLNSKLNSLNIIDISPELFSNSEKCYKPTKFLILPWHHKY